MLFGLYLRKTESLYMQINSPQGLRKQNTSSCIMYKKISAKYINKYLL